MSDQRRLSEMAGRPLLIGEFHFGACLWIRCPRTLRSSDGPGQGDRLPLLPGTAGGDAFHRGCALVPVRR